MGDANRHSDVRATLEALLAARGYRDVAVLGPFTSRGEERQYAVTIHSPDGTTTRMLRGTFAELRKAIAALPERE